MMVLYNPTSITDIKVIDNRVHIKGHRPKVLLNQSQDMSTMFASLGLERSKLTLKAHELNLQSPFKQSVKPNNFK